MPIRAALVVKDEIDIIKEHLDNMAEKLDDVVVLDNGSTDGTYDICREHPIVSKVIIDKTRFNCALRGKLFERMPDKRQTDWVVFLAADQFIEGDLRGLIAEASEDGCNAILADHAMFFYTKPDWDDRHNEDPSKSIRDRRLYYSVNFNWLLTSKAHHKLCWKRSHTDEWYIPLKITHIHRIVVSHYPLRTPGQIKRKLAARKESREKGTLSFTHYINKWHWWQYVFTTAGLDKRGPGEVLKPVYPVPEFDRDGRYQGKKYIGSKRQEDLILEQRAFESDPGDCL